MRPNLLDFTPSGQAIIDMPNYSEISFLESFGFSPIENVEKEIEQADTPERAAFLQHYVDTYKRTFTEPPRNYLKELEDKEVSLPDFEAPNNKSILLRNVRLLHTTAWYMMGHVDAEIHAVRRHLSELLCDRVVIDNLEEFINLTVTSKNHEEACARFQKRFEIGYVKTQYLLSMPLSKVTSFNPVKYAIEKEDYRQRLAFVARLKPSNMATAMYFNKKGIPY